jgi:alkylation response protein AidB-like acyl-CoA dehydrogenase
MDLKWNHAEEQFRAQVRAFLDEHLPDAWRVLRLDNDLEQGDDAIRRDWQRILNAHGWLKLSWPTELGGRGASPMFDAIYQAELAAAGAPPIWGRAGCYLLAPTLQVHASPDQQRRYVEPILAGDLFFCQAFSEPDAGSDLASLRTTATRVNGGWALNGQKCWSSGAMHADRAFLLARTDQDAPRHEAIGFFLIDMHQRGVDVVPTRQATGNAEFGEIFLADAFVSEEDVVDDPMKGWSVAMTTFSFERAAIANAMLLERALEEVIAPLVCGRNEVDPIMRQRLATAYARVKAFTWLSLRDLSRYQAGALVGAETSLSKIGWSETAKEVRSIALTLDGMNATLAVSPEEQPRNPWQHLWMWSAAQTVYGGTSEIQRNIVAERLLGLPR